MSEEKKYDAAWLSEREEYFCGLKVEIEYLLKKGVFDDKRIAIVGSWNNAGEVNRIIGELGLKLSIIADNNKNKQGVSRLGIISQSVDSLTNEEDIVILIINNIAWRELSIQLTDLGFSDGKSFFVLYGGEKYRNLEQRRYDLVLPEAEWENCKERMHLGYEAYVEIRKKYNNKSIWLMHQPSLGDLYIFSLFLPTALNKKSISECDCVLVVTKNSVRKLAEILGFRNIELITFDEANKNWLIMMRMFGDKIDVHNAVYHGENLIFQTLVHFSEVSFKDSFTKYVFKEIKDEKPIYPSFPKRKNIVKKIFEENNLIPGKTVLISPYAGHFIASISKKQWNRLVEGLIEKGYCVCTNSGGRDEPALEGTSAPFIDLIDCVEFVEQAGYFIGIRSGFCDLICMADCKKTVIYETGAPAGSINYFGFEKMGLGKNIKEVVNDCINTDELIDELISDY